MNVVPAQQLAAKGQLPDSFPLRLRDWMWYARLATRLTDCVARECMCDFIHFSKVVMPENIHTQVCSAV